MDAIRYFRQTQVAPPPERSIRTQVRTVEAQITNRQLLPINPRRTGASITNTSTGTLYLQFGAAASLESYIVKLEQDDTYEMPFHFTGLVNGIWTAPNGNAQVVEFS